MFIFYIPIRLKIPALTNFLIFLFIYLTILFLIVFNSRISNLSFPFLILLINFRVSNHLSLRRFPFFLLFIWLLEKRLFILTFNWCISAGRITFRWIFWFRSIASVYIIFNHSLISCLFGSSFFSFWFPSNWPHLTAFWFFTFRNNMNFRF